GLLASALDDCNAAQRLAVERRDAESATFARTRADEILPRVPRIRLELPAGRSPTRVTLDGQDAVLDLPSNTFLSNPGPHRLVVVLSGTDTRDLDVEIKPEAKVTVVTLREETAAMRPEVSEKPQPAPGESHGESHGVSRRTVGVVLGGVGAVGLL